jgi:HAD superfamily hydrolase (TIGR01509 family)
MLPRPVEAVVFDMDGLLVDSETMYRDCMMAVATRYGRELPLSVYLTMIGLAHPESRRNAVRHFGEDFPYDTYLQDVWAEASRQHEIGVPLKPGALELLDYLQAADLPCAIATSSRHHVVELQLGRKGLLPRFRAVVAGGDCARGKPHPDPFLAAAEKLGVDPTLCLALEDSHNGVRSAHAAGMMTVMVPDLLDATDEMRGLCVTVAASLYEVRAMLEAAPVRRTEIPAAAG